MKKSLLLLCLMAGFSSAASAASITGLDQLSVAEFKLLSEDFGAALSDKPLAPAEPLNLFGFDISAMASSTDISKSSAALNKASFGSIQTSTMIVPKLYAAVGLPFGIDVAAFVSSVPSSNVTLTGAELKVALLKGGTVSPSIAIRGAMTRMSGVDQLDFNTKSLDISISKGILMFTPYAGVGQVWVNSKASVAGTDGALDESFTQGKVFVGANMNLLFFNFALEADKTGGISTTSLKAGFRF
jgi:hypothetical protein